MTGPTPTQALCGHVAKLLTKGLDGLDFRLDDPMVTIFSVTPIDPDLHHSDNLLVRGTIDDEPFDVTVRFVLSR